MHVHKSLSVIEFVKHKNRRDGNHR